MAERLLVVGTGGFAKEVAQIARRMDPHLDVWNSISYVAASPAEIGQRRPYGLIDCCDADVLSGAVTADVVIAIGDPEQRRRAASHYAELPVLSFPNLIDPSVEVDREFVALGRGNVIHRHVVLTCDIVIGDFNVFNKSCIVAHDVHVGSFNDVHPAASLHGHVRLGNGCVVGAGARVLPKVSVADRTVIGAGAVLHRSVCEPGHVYAGVPARRLR
jgi:sugar O-acyltransferase (sialic acid O-acetyltransferase NeuD family)